MRSKESWTFPEIWEKIRKVEEWGEDHCWDSVRSGFRLAVWKIKDEFQKEKDLERKK